MPARAVQARARRGLPPLKQRARAGSRMWRMERTVLFADVAGSTALYELLGDERAFALVEQCLALMGACTAEAGGRVVKTIGDAVMAAFATPAAAATAARAMQQRIGTLSTEPGVHLQLRIGLHAGPVVERAGDLFGDAVNLAARLCDLASRGQVVLDEATAAQLGAELAAALHPLYSVPVKGKAEEVGLVELDWQAGAPERTLIAPPARPRGGTARLAVAFDGQQLEMGPERRKVTIGRDHEADLTVRERSASRAHAMIERRRDRFVLVDHSANGSFVSLDGRPEVVVHREELPLIGAGRIAFGQPLAEAAQVLEFRHLDTPPMAGA